MTKIRSCSRTEYVHPKANTPSSLEPTRPLTALLKKTEMLFNSIMHRDEVSFPTINLINMDLQRSLLLKNRVMALEPINISYLSTAAANIPNTIDEENWDSALKVIVELQTTLRLALASVKLQKFAS